MSGPAELPAAPGSPQDPFDADFQRRLQRLSLIARRTGSGQVFGQRDGGRAGAGVAFAEHRAYVPGDDFRHIDWRAFGRLRRLLVRRFEQEEDLSVQLLVDRSSSMQPTGGQPSKLWQAKRVAGALAYLSLSRLDRVAVTGLGGTPTSLPLGRGRGHLFGVLNFLRGLSAEGQTDLATSLQQVAAARSTGGLAVLISDMFDPAGFARGLDALRFARFEVLVVQVTARTDADPALSGPMTLCDAETGLRRDLLITPALLTRYQRRYRAHLAALERYCGEHQLRYCPIDASLPLDEAVLALVRQRSLAAR